MAALLLLLALSLADAVFGAGGTMLWVGGSVGGAVILGFALAASVPFWRR
ncbi:MAG: hypothetical protein K2X11_19225 [Acetobacteraceae bacterium]|nr:hypothetical protein [Acetobacteraceae bacterium]